MIHLISKYPAPTRPSGSTLGPVLIGVLGFMLAVVLSAAPPKPEGVLQVGWVTPRSDLTTTEALVWRSQLTLRHQINERLSWYFA